jgi:hypothetical protein
LALTSRRCGNGGAKRGRRSAYEPADSRSLAAGIAGSSDPRAHQVLLGDYHQPAKGIAVGYDQLANVALNGDEDETISSRAHRAAQNGRAWGCVLCKLLDKLDKNHCEKSAGV